MNVIVIGGCGAMGKAAVWDLVENPCIDDIAIGDKNLEKAQQLCRDISSSKVKAYHIDVHNKAELALLIKGWQVVINAATYDLNLDIMECCLQSGVNYVDLGGLYHVTHKQMEFHQAFIDKGLSAIIGMGASPGMTNIAARMGGNRLDKVFEIHIRTGAKGSTKGFAYSTKTILDEVTMNPVLYQEKKFVELPALSGREKYRLPEPVDDVEGFFSIHSELATLSHMTADIHTVTFRVAFSPALVDLMEKLVELKFTDDEPLFIDSIPISPKKFLYHHLARLPEPEYAEEFKAFQVDVIGEKNGKKSQYRYTTLVESNEDKKLRATAIWTGVPASVAADCILNGDVLDIGVLAPEQALDPELFIQKLADRNIVIKEQQIL